MSRARAPEVSTLVELLALRSRGSSELVILDERERAWPIAWAEVLERSRRTAAGLASRGIERGERVAIMLPTGVEFIASFFGTLLAGGIPVPVAPPFFLDRIDDFTSAFEGIARSSQPSFLITFKDIRWLAAGATRASPSLREVITPEVLSADGPAPDVVVSPSDACFLQYTSGSTGTPKGVMISHQNVLANVRGIGERVEARTDDVCVNWLPLYHDMGLIGSLLTSLYWGAPLVLMSPQAFVKYPIRWLRALTRYRGTVSPAPNFAYRVCLKIADDALGGLDLSAWRVAFNGAEPVDVDTMERFAARFQPFGFSRRALLPVYGLAEATLAVTHPRLDAPLVTEHLDVAALVGEEGAAVPASAHAASVSVVSVGYPLDGTEVGIFDDAGARLPERKIGEIRVRGPAVMSGYFRDRDATRAVLATDGWLSTGDLGYLAEGRLFVTSRKKDLVIKGGKNFHPHDIEDAARAALGGERRGRVVAFGAPDPSLGTERAIVLVETRATLDAEAARQLAIDVRAAVMRRVGLSVDVVEVVPPRTILRTSSGKVRRAETRAVYLSGDLVRPKAVASRIPLVLAVARSAWQLGRLRVRRAR